MAYLRLKIGSLWFAVIYQASSYIFIHKLFTLITVQNADSSWFIDEFGAVIAVFACCVAVYFRRKGVVEYTAVKP
ncbi:hypothetical protein [Litorilituus lipolyticus]|uniref:hypothetical protein n=1 Tax=Litorilituus lipolyticus TaxID=2491017 RepID=UPI001BA7C3F1|nr:hypothetical protein [Litorilituus lipolyticus]